MNNYTGITKRMPAIKKIILLILIITMMTMAFSTVLAPQAEAASYKVKMFKWGDDEYDYCVYKGQLPKMYAPTFLRFDTDVYKSGKMKIYFYWPEVLGFEANEEMTEAFCRYLGNKTKGSWTTIWHSFNIDFDPYIFYYPCIITGWNSNKGDSIDKLLNKSPFTNSRGDKLYLEKIGNGNLVKSCWSDIRDKRYCSWADYYPKQNVTIGFRFVDYNGKTIYLYCPNF